MLFLLGLLFLAVLAVADHFINGGRRRARKQRPKPVSRPRGIGYRPDSASDMMMAYAVADFSSGPAVDPPERPNCEDAPLDGDVGENPDDCDPDADMDSVEPDDGASDGWDSGDGDAGDWDAGESDSGWDSGGSDSGGGDSPD